MKTALSEFIEEINRNRKSGLLSITVKGANTLLKLFFREGEVYHATCGNVRGSACLAQASGNDFAEYFFMPDIALNVLDENLPPLADIIRYFSDASSAAEVQLRPGTGGASRGQSVSGPPTAQENLKLALIRQIGPVGAKVISRIVEQTWKASSPPTREELLQLIDLLKVEIENPDDRSVFVKEATAILS